MRFIFWMLQALWLSAFLPAFVTSRKFLYDCEITEYDNIVYKRDPVAPPAKAVVKVTSAGHCFNQCFLDPTCVSFNYLPQQEACTYHTTGILNPLNLKISLKNGNAAEANGTVHVHIDSCPETATKVTVGCGKQDPNYRPTIGAKTRIIGGNEAKPHSWPWQVYLQSNQLDGQYEACGGSLIRVKNNREMSDIIVTAAHCVTWPHTKSILPIARHPSQILALVGIHRWDALETGTQARGLEKIIVHPDFKMPFHDIAVIKLSKPVKFSDTVRPICLPPKGAPIPVGKTCAAVGWGRHNSTDFATSPVLKQLQVPVHNASTCTAGVWGTDKDWPYIEDQMICAGDLQGNEGVCNGDSGGMLACEEAGTWTLYGATSFGVTPSCLLAGAPGVFARISNYVDWITETVRKISMVH